MDYKDVLAKQIGCASGDIKGAELGVFLRKLRKCQSLPISITITKEEIIEQLIQTGKIQPIRLKLISKSK